MRQILTLALTAFVLYGCVENRNVPLPYSITEALEFENYKERLQGVRLYFGNQSHPAVEKSYREQVVQRKSSAVERESKESGARALATALLTLRLNALNSGGDAIINIISNYRGNEVSSETHYQCATGVLMSGISVKGTIVKLRN